jgi:hypothetical protein
VHISECSWKYLKLHKLIYNDSKDAVLHKQHEQSLLLIDQKQMEVCDVCGSFLIVNDAQARVEEHISGKQHMGYAKLRSALEEIRVI